MTTTNDIPTLSLFCGAGGDYEGASQVDGIRGVGAANHSHLAIASHSENHPDVPHYEVDIRQFNPAEYANHTLLLATPECRAHSYSPGLKEQPEAESLADDDTLNREASREQSRMTMFEVGRVLAAKAPAYAIVENVPEVMRWRKFGQWEQAIRTEGYSLQFVNLNAQFVSSWHPELGLSKVGSPTPQTRDRLFIVCTQHGHPQPDMTFSPLADCERCGEVEAQQVFKRTSDRAGRYNRQYIYVCPHCWSVQQCLTRSRKAALVNSQVKPYTTPASTLIDWSLPCPLIGDRPKLLRPATLQRVALGLLRYGPQAFVVETSRTYAPHDHITGLEQVLPTQTSRQTLAVVKAGPVTTEGQQKGNHKGQPKQRADSQQLTLPFLAELRGGSTYREISEPLSTVTTSGAHHALVQPTEHSTDFLLQFYSRTDATQSVNTPLHTVTTEPRHALVKGAAPTSFFVDYYGTEVSKHHVRTINQPLPTQASVVGHALTHWQGEWSNRTVTQQQLWEAVLSCGLRMLTPTEIIEAMGFYRYRGKGNYVLLGNQREQTKLAGIAVVPVVMEALVRRVQQAITGQQRHHQPGVPKTSPPSKTT